MDSEDDGAQIIICTLFYEAIKVDCFQLKINSFKSRHDAQNKQAFK